MNTAEKIQVDLLGKAVCTLAEKDEIKQANAVMDLAAERWGKGWMGHCTPSTQRGIGKMVARQLDIIDKSAPGMGSYILRDALGKGSN